MGKNNTGNQDEFIKINDDTMKKVILDYTRGEAGVRNFERRLGTLCRFKAVEYCEWLNKDIKNYNPIIDENDLPIYLGVPYSLVMSLLKEQWELELFMDYHIILMDRDQY